MAPTLTVMAFCLLLTWLFVLYQPTDGPGELQKMGWQAWDSVSFNTQPGSTPASEADTEESTPSGVDWWNVTARPKPIDTASLPLDIWSPLLPHVTGCEWVANPSRTTTDCLQQ